MRWESGISEPRLPAVDTTRSSRPEPCRTVLPTIPPSYRPTPYRLKRSHPLPTVPLHTVTSPLPTVPPAIPSLQELCPPYRLPLPTVSVRIVHANVLRGKAVPDDGA